MLLLAFGQQTISGGLLLERRLGRGHHRLCILRGDGNGGQAVESAVRPATIIRLEIELGLLLDGRRHRLVDRKRGLLHLCQYLPLEVEEEVDGSEVGVVADVGPAADDGDALQPGEGDGESDADVGADPEESARGGHGGDVDEALRLRHLARGQYPRDVGGDVDVLQVPECLGVVEADGARVLQSNPQTHTCRDNSYY